MLTRRDFIKKSLIIGSSMLLTPGCLRAEEKEGEKFYPAYHRLEEEGKLAGRIEQAQALFENCEICPRRCGVNRLQGEQGFCRAPARPVIYSGQPHFGEEISLVGRRGSGTIFFSNCNLRCVFCQNWPRRP